MTEVDNGDESVGGGTDINGTAADTPDGKKQQDSGGGGGGGAASGAAGSKAGSDGDFGIGALAGMMDNLDQFVLEPSPKGCVVKCRITRDRKGMDRGNGWSQFAVCSSCLECLLLFFTSLIKHPLKGLVPFV